MLPTVTDVSQLAMAGLIQQTETRAAPVASFSSPPTGRLLGVAGVAARFSGQPGFPLSVAGGEPVIFIRLREQVFPGLGVLNPLRHQARFLRLQAPVIGMAQGDFASGHDALPYTGGSATELSATDACAIGRAVPVMPLIWGVQHS